MTELTNDEIIKALECCIADPCERYVLLKRGLTARKVVFQATLDFINRQQAEIERLKLFEKKVIEPVVANLEENLRLENENNELKTQIERLRAKNKKLLQKLRKTSFRTIEQHNEFVQQRLKDCIKARNRAMEEFWEKLKSQSTMDKRIISVETGDNLLKEMVGENNV